MKVHDSLSAEVFAIGSSFVSSSLWTNIYSQKKKKAFTKLEAYYDGDVGC